jgi:hypothetical protein
MAGELVAAGTQSKLVDGRRDDAIDVMVERHLNGTLDGQAGEPSRGRSAPDRLPSADRNKIARALARHLASPASVPAALAAYDAERRPPTAEIVLTNRKGGPEGVIDVVEARAPDGFTDIEAIASHAERQAIVRGYASMAGYAREQVNRR